MRLWCSIHFKIDNDPLLFVCILEQAYIPKSVFSQTPKLDQNNIKHTIPEPVVQKCNNMFFLIPALMKFIRNSLV